MLVVLALVTVGLIAVGVRQSMSATCEVCITYNGRTVCRTAVGANEAEAATTATQNACGLMTAGMTQIVQCQNKQPDSVVCEP